jgi:hypothetical protein
MTQTNIEYFNSTLKLFVTNINKSYPEYSGVLNEYYNDILENDSCNDDKYVKRFMRKFNEHKEPISTKNNDLFSDSICFLKNIDFKDIWENEKTDESIKDTIWDYIQTLYVIGETIISDSNKIRSLVESLKKKRSNEPLDENDSEENKELMDMLKNLSEKKDAPQIDENILNNGLIGKLAKELAGDINLDDMNLNLGGGEDGEMPNIGDIFGKLMGGDNPMKFMNLIQNVGQKIQSKLTDGNLDQSKLLDEAKNMMGMLGNNNPLFDTLLGNAKKEMSEANPPNNPSHNNPTRDRLKKKLEARKK